MPKRDIRSQSHSFYDCKYHIVFTPKYRWKVFESKYLKEEIRRIIKLICKWKQIEILEWHVSSDHIHLLVIIPPKYSVSYVMQIIKWKSSSWLKKKNKSLKIQCKAWSFWSRWYFVSTVWIDDIIIRRYVKHQEKHHQVDLQWKLF